MRKRKAAWLALTLLLFASTAEAADAWTVYYLTPPNAFAGEPFPAITFGDGSYLVMGGGPAPVYVHQTNWVYLGTWGTAPTPDTFPDFVRTSGIYVGLTPNADVQIVATPELAIGRTLMRHVGGERLAASLNPALQRITTIGASALLGAERDGNRIYLRAVTLDVVEWCSGLVTMKWLLVLGVLLVLVGRTPWPANLLLVLTIPLVAIEVNIARVAAIGLGYQFGYGWEIKEWIGWGTLALGVTQIATFGWLVRR